MQQISSKIIKGDIEKKITDSYKCLKTPIFKATSFDYNNSIEMEKAFKSKNNNYTYSQIVPELQNRLNLLSKSQNTICVSSEIATISDIFITTYEKENNIITSNFILENTYSFFTSTIGSFDVETKFVKFDSIDKLEQKIDEKRRTILIEIPTTHKNIAKIENPSLKSSSQCDLAESSRLFNLNLKNKKYCFNLMDSFKMIKKRTIFCNNKSMVAHSSSTIYWNFNQKQKE